MKRLFKWIVGVVLVLTAIAGCAVAFLSQTLQPASGIADLDGLSAPVSVTRDANGIPHIIAETQADAAMALGFTHAQDRLWQMNFLRMTGQGRLSEILGVNKDVQDIDIFLRTLGFSEQAESSISHLNAESRRVLDAYAAGVNAFLERDRGLLEPNLPPEFLILGHSPEPWKAEHSLVVLKLMSLQLSMNMSREIDRLSLAARGLSSAEIDDVMPYHRDENPPPLPDMRRLFKLASPEETASKPINSRFADLKMRLVDEAGQWASNNWVLSGSKTKSGKSLLANDPHLSFSTPSLWYLAHLSWKVADGSTQNVIGGTIPAVPAVVLGRNDDLAWGFTNAGADVQDLFVEQIKPDDPNFHFTPTGWKKMEVIKEKIKVKGGKDIIYDRRISRNGPLLPRTFKSYGNFLRADNALALKWTGMSKEDISFQILNELSTAKTVKEFGRAVDPTISPMQAIVVADKAGSIGLFSKAAVPVRKRGSQFRGRAPAPGWTDEEGWVGLVPREKLPAIIDPIEGAIGTANSRFVSNNSDPFLTHDWDEPFRHDWVQGTMVSKKGKLDMQDMIGGQNDMYSPALSDLRDVLLDQMGSPSAHQEFIAKLRDWDGVMRADRAEPLVMTAFFRKALEGVLKDDLGPVFKTVHVAPATALLRILKQGGSRDWCDVRLTTPKETCSEVLQQAFEAAITELSKEFGSDSERWTWGAAHRVANEHQPFGKVAALSWLFNVERSASGGAYALLRGKTDLGSDTPYRAVHGAGYRAIYDFVDLNKSFFVTTTGQSGNVFSPQYDDQADLWAEGKYLQMTTDPDDYSTNALGTWKLSPKRN